MKVWILSLVFFTASAFSKPINIAHRGASAYLPEHTLEAAALAYGMKPDFIEQDLVMTKDDHLIVLHDHHLDQVTNVAQVFPKRHRKDGRYYVIDFTLAEIKSLRVSERFHHKTKQAYFKNRFPSGQAKFEVATFSEEVELIQGLNHSLNYNVGIYPEIKSPVFHRNEGKDISLALIRTLKKYGYTKLSDKIYLQCFDRNEVRRLKKLMKQSSMSLPIVQLMNGYDFLPDIPIKEQLQKIREDTYFIGVDMDTVFQKYSQQTFMKIAHELGMKVHVYTLRKDDLPKEADTFSALLQRFIHQEKVDGVFTDFPDEVYAYLQSN